MISLEMVHPGEGASSAPERFDPMVAPPSIWRAPICYPSPIVAAKARETLDSLGWKYERDRGLHHFSRLYIAISIPSNSYVFQFLVGDPVSVVINVYDERPTHTGELHFVEVKGITRRNAPSVRLFLQELAGSLPRRPYQFFWVERFKLGFLNRAHMLAKSDWAHWGI